MVKAEVVTKDVKIRLELDLKMASLIHAMTQLVAGCPHESYRADADDLNRALTKVLSEVDDCAMSDLIGSKVNKKSPHYGITFLR